MQVIVHMLAFREGDLRVVDVPDVIYTTDELLDAVFHYGQNDIQPMPFPSVSVGDVIQHGANFYMVLPLGFGPITPEELSAHRALPRIERSLAAYKREPLG